MKSFVLSTLTLGNKVSYNLLRFLLLSFCLVFSQHLLSQAPVITSFTPTSAAKGNTVIITGTNFSGATAVSFGGTPATSFSVLSATQISAIVPLGTSGIVSVTRSGFTGTRAGFYYLPLSGIVTDYAGYWSTTTSANSTMYPDNSHNLLAFTYNGITFSTGVNNGILTGQGINYTPGVFKALPVANIAGTNTASSIYLSMASKMDGSAAVANAAAFPGITVKDVMTDGPNGLNMGTGITNLPTSALMTFDIHIIDSAKLNDAEPDLVITQIAQPTSVNDQFVFVDALGNTIGNAITQDMNLLNKLGTYYLDLFDLSPGTPFNSAVCYSASSTNTTREIRLVGFKLSDFGITTSNYMQVSALKIIPSGTSDYAFIAYSEALKMSPNIDQNPEMTNSSICTGGTAHLEVIATAAYGGLLSYSWEVSANGGIDWIPVSNGGNYTGASTNRLSVAAANHAYKYRATVVEAGTGFNAVSSVFTISVIAPAAPSAVSITASGNSTCLNSLLSLSSTVTGGSSLNYQWETNASGSYANIPGAILKTYLPPVNASGITSYRLRVSSGSGCNSIVSGAVIITVVGISSTTPASRCGTGVVSMSAVATSGSISWYAASTGGTALATGGTYSPSIVATTTYYISTDAAQCNTGIRVPITATINSLTWAGTNTTDWSTLANWDCGGTPPPQLPNMTNSITIPTHPSGGRFPVISTTATINNIAIAPSASITVANNGTFEIYGTITNQGNFTATSGTISMRGSTQQLIPANTFITNTIKNLTINNTAGVLLGGALNLTGTFTPTAGTLTTFGHLTLKSDANGTARVAAGTGTYIIGNVNVERYIPERRSWRLMTTPLSNTNTFFQSWQNGGVFEPGKGLLVTAPGGGIGIDEAGNSSLKTWNVALQSLQTVSNTKVPISRTNNGSADNTPYFIFVRGDRTPENIDHNLIRKNNTTLTSTGYLQTGTQDFKGLSRAANAFTLIGNPYAAPIDWNLVLANPGTSNIKRKFYVWDPRFNSVGGYTAMDDAITPGVFMPTPANSSQTNFIQSSQAVFVITNASAPASVQISENNKAGTNNTAIFGRPFARPESLVINLLLPNAGDSVVIEADGLRADFRDDFSAAVDDNDNIKLSNVNENFGLVRNNVSLATERRPSIKGRDTLFLKLSKSTQRSYRFQFQPANFRNPLLVAMLEDSYTGIPTMLSLTEVTNVNFSLNADAASRVSNRFRVIFFLARPLPVSFAGIRAFEQNEDVAVEWKVEQESGIKQYEVERSLNGRNFEQVNITSATGASRQQAKYLFIDLEPATGKSFYRVKSVGINGEVKYSGVAKVNRLTDRAEIKEYPNPVVNKLMNVEFVNQPRGTYSVKLISSIGQVLTTTNVQHGGGSATEAIYIPASTSPGTYQVKINSESGVVTILSVLVK